jgi:hypothetical protein
LQATAELEFTITSDPLEDSPKKPEMKVAITKKQEPKKKKKKNEVILTDQSLLDLF